MRGVMVLAAMLSGVPATAAIKTVVLDTNFFLTPYTYDFGGGSSITLTTVDPSYFAYNPAGVSTGGSTQVGSFGAPFYDPPQPTSYFFNRGGSFGPGGELPLFLSYATPAAVPYSISEGLVGFRFDLGQGYQYGYADVAGSTLFGLRYQTTPGVSVPFGAVPEPATWALMIGGFGLVGVARRAERAVAAAA